jgi:hypothetical protein
METRATTQKLYAGLGAVDGFDEKSLRYLSRECQRADILPTGKRGGGSAAARVTTEQTAMFLIAAMFPGSAREAVKWAKKMGKLKYTGGEKPERLKDFFAWLLENALTQADVILDISTLVFDETEPQGYILTLETRGGKRVKVETNYVEKPGDITHAERAAYAPSGTVNGNVITVLARVLFLEEEPKTK